MKFAFFFLYCFADLVALPMHLAYALYDAVPRYLGSTTADNTRNDDQNAHKKHETLDYPFYHRENLLNFFLLSDLLIFVATISWMELSQCLLFDGNVDADATKYFISPLYLFQHCCDSLWTYIWITMFNASAIIAITIVIICVYTVQRGEWEPACIILITVSIVAFVVVSTLPIIAFISFFKLSVFALSSLLASNMCLTPAVYSPHLLFPLHINVCHQHSDRFYQALYRFLAYDKSNAQIDMFRVFCTSLLSPIFVFLEDEVALSVDCRPPKGKELALDVTDDDYELRTAIANKILAERYNESQWISSNDHKIIQTLRQTSYAQCSTLFVRRLRGYVTNNVCQVVLSSLRFMRHQTCATDVDGHHDTYQTLLNVQYLLIMVAFIPLQTIFAIFGLFYPYIVIHELMRDFSQCYIPHDSTQCHNEIMRFIVLNGMRFSHLFNYNFFVIFCVSCIMHSCITCCIIYKIYHLRYVFAMCLNVLFVRDHSMISFQPLIEEMKKQQTNIKATKIRNLYLSEVFGRYHLDRLIIEYAGQIHECAT
mmetsp:Transcript_50325/g.83781  ORF Transcript_50325/g.83781 Transcript_50325/m.83781 type:complete len:539 (-) Transcript_50325:17-1633(-)